MSDTPFDPNSLDALPAADPLENALTQAGLGAETANAPPVYKVMPDSRIPVSSKRGKLWRSRKDNAKKQMGDLIDAWDEAIRYYNHDQSGHRDDRGDPNYSGNRLVARRLNEKHSATENIVFSNVNAQVPELYAKNPTISMSSVMYGADEEPVKDQNDEFARAGEKLINALFSMKSAPGVSIKPKAKRNVLVALLTNHSWFEVGYITKDKSSEQALADLQEVSDKLKSAKDEAEIHQCEAELFALDEKIEFLQPSGPFVRVRLPHQVLIDPDSNDPYLTDAHWVMIEDMIPTEYINAVYGKRDTEQPDGEVKSIFEPTHVLSSGASSDSDDENISLFNSDKNTYSAYGFEDQSSYEKSKRTKVWYVWDKVTRRLEMYADNDWSWPIWVWDDPYQLQNFFPLTPMWFHDNPTAIFAKGEVSYYLDQQDQINEINDEKRRALLWGRRNIFYDTSSGLTQEQADRILSGGGSTAVPLRIPDGKDGQKLIFSILPPSAAFAALYEKQDIYQAVDRIASTNEVERGGQFKTNTTNKAIDYYSTMGNMRMDMRLDAIEDALGDVGWKMFQLCLRFMDAVTVQQITGLDVSAFWRPLDGLADYAQWSVVCVGGSTTKLTSQAKKQEAVQVGQVLSQYVKAAPKTVLRTTLTMFSKAFDEFEIQKEDWDAIAEEVLTTLTAGQGGAPGMPPPGAQPGAPPPGPPGGGGPPGGNPMQMAAMVVEALKQLPPPVLQAIGGALAQGVPPDQILQQMMQQMQGGGGGGPPGPPGAPPGPLHGAA